MGLKVTYEDSREGYYPKALIRLAQKADVQKDLQPEFNEFLDMFNRALADAFEAGRDFQRRYNEDD